MLGGLISDLEAGDVFDAGRATVEGQAHGAVAVAKAQAQAGLGGEGSVELRGIGGFASSGLIGAGEPCAARALAEE